MSWKHKDPEPELLELRWDENGVSIKADGEAERLLKMLLLGMVCVAKDMTGGAEGWLDALLTDLPNALREAAELAARGTSINLLALKQAMERGDEA